MKVNPGDLIIDKNLKRTLTVLNVKKMTYANMGSYNLEYDMIEYMASNEPQGKVNKVLEYELDAWVGLELVRVKS